jgi:hypothetical protein
VEIIIVRISRPNCFALRDYILASSHKRAEFTQIVRKALRVTYELLDRPIRATKLQGITQHPQLEIAVLAGAISTTVES